MTAHDAAKTRKLANGHAIPLLGLGVWQVPDGKTCEDAVRWALQAGYRHIDTAQAYGNGWVGQGVNVQTTQRVYDSFVAAQTLLLGASLIKGSTAYKPPEIEYRVTLGLQENFAHVNERRILFVGHHAGEAGCPYR